ncbi:polysaccharide deacetylase family protein [Streptomyces sp. O3]
MAATKRLVAGVTVAVCAVALSGCAGGGESRTGEGANGPSGAKKAQPAPAPKSAVRLIGDGSTAFTGAQPNLAKPEKLKPGEKPPQFVVFSWDGAGEDSQKLFSYFRKVAKANDATMTYFLSGVYMLPEDKKELYDPPRHSAGRSDIGFNDRQGIKDTVEQLRGAWLEGNEIGTHFNGHFCGKGGGVGEWSVADWKSEIAQAKAFVKEWKSNTGTKKAEPLPFDYDQELIGGRTPCLEGQRNFMQAARELGFRYDTSGVNNQLWPKKKNGLWDLSMQLVPVPGRAFETLTMDYNFMVNQSGSTSQGDPAKHEYWGDQMRDGLLQGFQRAYDGNRAPLIIGNHFESWNGGTYMRAIEETIERVCTKRDVRCVSFRQLADWLDAQDPRVLAKLRELGVGEAPKRGWAGYLAAQPAPAPKGVPGAEGVKSAEGKG